MVDDHGHDIKRHAHVLFHWDLERVASCVCAKLSLCVRVRGAQIVVYVLHRLASARTHAIVRHGLNFLSFSTFLLRYYRR